MLNASASSPAPAYFAGLNGIQRSASFKEPTSGESIPSDENSDGGDAGLHRPGLNGRVEADVRRAVSLRVPGSFGGARPIPRDVIGGGMSFGAAGSNLSSPLASGRSTSTNFNPPLAARHALFSHHASPPVRPVEDEDGMSEYGLSGSGISTPPSPSGSISSGAFSPASAFLSHFSSSGSLHPGNMETVSAPDSQGSRVLDYILGKLIGRGGFSFVRKAHHVTTGEVLACKIVKRSDLSDTSGSLENFEEEIRIWEAFPRHPSILALLEMHRTSDITFLITPYLPGGSLLDVLKREDGSDKTARKWFPGVVKAVAALHEGYEGFEGQMLHGDLKLDNFLVDHAGNVMVTDFYMAKSLLDISSSNTKSIAVPTPISSVPPPAPSSNRHFLPSTPGNPRGPRHSLPFSQLPGNHPKPIDGLPIPKLPSASLPYAPPELLRAPPSAPTLAQDIWAIGIILHALLTGRLPFMDSYDPRLQMKILRGTYPEPSHMGGEWLECLRGCLDIQKENRWPIGRVKTCDAVIGWQEVRARRSRSRSRSRQRLPGEYRKPFGDHLRDGSAQPVPIHRRRAHSRASPASTHTPQRDSPDPPRSAPGTRSRSASASRSRSSGRGRGTGTGSLMESHSNQQIRAMDVDMSSLSLTHGRSSSRRADHFPVHFPEHFPEPNIGPAHVSRHESSSLLPDDPMREYNPGASRARSSSRKRMDQSMMRNDVHMAHTPERSGSRGYDGGSSQGGDSGRSRTSFSRSASKTGSRSGSRSRSRAGDGEFGQGYGRNGENGHGHGRGYGYEGYDTGPLDVVREEWKGEEDRGRRGRPER